MSSAQAVTVAKQAVQLDHAGRAGQALAKYQEAIALIIPLIKGECLVGAALVMHECYGMAARDTVWCAIVGVVCSRCA